MENVGAVKELCKLTVSSSTLLYIFQEVYNYIVSNLWYFIKTSVSQR